MKRLFRRFFRLLLFGGLLLFGLMIINMIRFSSMQMEVDQIPDIPLSERIFDRLTTAIRLPTVSGDQMDTSVFLQLDTFFEKQFPRVHQELDKEKVNDLSFIYKWPGKNNKLKPILLAAHLDVVPVEEHSLSEWTHPPFSGMIADGFVWGRGALDDKMSALALLETVELLLEEGYYPTRTVYLAFGHDEEISGRFGAAAMAELFQTRKIEFEYVLDEGLVVLENALSGLDAPLAMIGISEKGYASLELKAVLEEGGHSMMPSGENAVGVLSNVIHRLEENPLPASLGGPLTGFFDHVGPEMSFFNKLIMSNRWLTESLITQKLSKDPASNALIRTTIAPTMLQAGIRDNVMPTEASAIVNVRIRPGETMASVKEFVEEVIGDDPVEVSVFEPEQANDPPPVSSQDAFGFEVIEKTIREVIPDAVVAPSLVIGRTDARYYASVSDQIYRFTPVVLNRSDLQRIHGLNERISQDNYRRMIRFYRLLIMNSCK
jgi:carboxypeptidase PM20D1